MKYILPKPRASVIRRYKNDNPELSREPNPKECATRWDFNWLDTNAYLANWAKLSLGQQETLSDFMDSDLKGNCYRQGMKVPTDFAKHLLLMIGSEIWDMLPYSDTNMVKSNLKFHSGKYSRDWTRSRLIDARTCRFNANKYMKSNNLNALFRYFDAQSMVFESCEDLRGGKETTFEYRDRVKALFRKNVEFLQKSQRKKRISSFIYSHEISCDSILGMRFRPHTHAVVFYFKDTAPPDLETHFDVPCCLLKVAPEVHNSLGTIKNLIHYMHRAASLSATYEREYHPDRVIELNRWTVQAWRRLLETAGAGWGERSYKRFGDSRIPRAGGRDFNHPHIENP